jgi:tetratricopeptide (TPR) repeat protein
LIEKIPFFLIALLFVFLSSLSARRMGVLLSAESASFTLRIENALVSYVAYIGKMIWPQRLAFLYPYPDAIPLWQTAGSVLLLACITVFVIRFIGTAPYLSVGWFWYAGTLVPVIGLVQQGFWPKMADRFAYMPFIGLYIMIAWGAADRFEKWRWKKTGMIAAAGVLFLSFLLLTAIQAATWKNSITLYAHAVSVTAKNYLAYNNLGNAYLRQGRMAEAVEQYHKALHIFSVYAEAHCNLGVAFFQQGKTGKAIYHFREALRITPDSILFQTNLKAALNRRDRQDRPATGHPDN